MPRGHQGQCKGQRKLGVRPPSIKILAPFAPQKGSKLIFLCILRTPSYIYFIRLLSTPPRNEHGTLLVFFPCQFSKCGKRWWKITGSGTETALTTPGQIAQTLQDSVSSSVRQEHRPCQLPTAGLGTQPAPLGGRQAEVLCGGATSCRGPSRLLPAPWDNPRQRVEGGD